MSTGQVMSPIRMFDDLPTSALDPLLQRSSRISRQGFKRQKLSEFDVDRLNMSNYFYNAAPSSTSADEDELNNMAYHAPGMQTQQQLPNYGPLFSTPFTSAQQPTYQEQANYWQQPTHYQSSQLSHYHEVQQHWIPQQVPSNETYEQQNNPAPFPVFTESLEWRAEQPTAGPNHNPRSTPAYLSPPTAPRTRISRSVSIASSNRSDISRSTSPNASEMAKWGFKNGDGSWSCAYPGCASRSTFTRGCDLRKHYKRHTKSLFCRTEGCPQATEGGFSSKKDRARHEAKHNPTIVCEWDGCGRLFSRQDNMKDHVRRVHKRRVAS